MITLTAIKSLIYERFQVCKVLVIAPLRPARDTWPGEIAKWDHLKDLTYSVAIGTKEQRLAALRAKADIYIINRENVPWLVEKSGIDFDFDMVVIDELSSFKNYTAKRFRSLMSVRHRVSRIVGLTGTPSSNGLMDLFAEFKVLDGGKRLGRYISRYRDRYFLPDKRNAQVVFTYKLRPGAEEQIYNAISDITISMTAPDYLDMPACIYNQVKVKLSDKERGLYDEFRKQMVVSLGGEEIDAMNAAALTNKLLQMANGAVYDTEHNVHSIHDRKLEALEDLIEGANGKPVLVGYWFKHDLARISKRFDVRELKSSQDIADWNAGKIPVAVIHPASAGHGLNLQYGGCTLIWFGLTWSLEVRTDLVIGTIPADKCPSLAAGAEGVGGHPPYPRGRYHGRAGHGGAAQERPNPGRTDRCRKSGTGGVAWTRIRNWPTRSSSRPPVTIRRHYVR